MDDFTIHLIEWFDEVTGTWQEFDAIEYSTRDEACEAIAIEQASRDLRFRVHTLGYFDIPAVS